MSKTPRQYTVLHLPLYIRFRGGMPRYPWGTIGRVTTDVRDITDHE